MKEMPRRIIEATMRRIRIHVAEALQHENNARLERELETIIADAVKAVIGLTLSAEAASWFSDSIERPRSGSDNFHTGRE